MTIQIYKRFKPIFYKYVIDLNCLLRFVYWIYPKVLSYYHWKMYNLSLDGGNRKMGVCAHRSNDKYIFRTKNKIGTKNQEIPYYIGTMSWNDIVPI